MNRNLLNSLTLAGLVSLVPTIASAQCRTCAPSISFAPVAAPAPINCTISQTRPVVTTQLRPQQVTTYRDVTETQVQRQQVVENVPVTKCKNVTVDEGGYQMVWVAKPVTRQVSETTIQQNIKTVEVPVQVTRRVAQQTTQMVPVQSVQYVNQQVPVQAMAVAQPFCDTCASGRPFGMTAVVPQIGYLAPVYPAPVYSTPTALTAAIPSTPISNPVAPQHGSAPVQAFLPHSKSLVPTAEPTKSASAADAYETVPAREVPVPKDEAATAPTPARKTSMFTGVPSAAAVWQSRNSVLR